MRSCTVTVAIGAPAGAAVAASSAAMPAIPRVLCPSGSVMSVFTSGAVCEMTSSMNSGQAMNTSSLPGLEGTGTTQANSAAGPW